MVEFTRWLVEQESMSREADATRRIANSLGERLTFEGAAVELLNDPIYGSTVRARFDNTATGSSADKQVLNVNDGTEPNSYDPTQQTYTYEAGVGREVFETLLKSNPAGTDVQPAAASSFDVSSDGLTYTFHLRSNLWHV